MILTQEEYIRGFIDFDAVLPEDCKVELWTRTADNPRDDAEWTGPYSTPEGNVVLSPPKSYVQLQIGLKRGDDPTKMPILNKVRWERDGKTFIWPGPYGFNGPPSPFILGRDYGVSYRLAFQPKRATWPEPFVIIDSTVRIKFWKGGIKGHRISGFHDALPTPEGNFSVEGNLEEVETEGDVVEVLATVPGNDEEKTREAAKTQVETIIGLLSLCFGEQILGQPIFTDYYISSATGEQGDIPVPVKHLLELTVDKDLAPFVDDNLVSLYESQISGSVGIALRWYASGLSSESPVDAFIAYFIGLEALASGYFTNISPKPVRKEYTQFQKYFAKAQPKMDSGLRDIVLARIADFPLTMKFETYWKNRFMHETRDSKEFFKFNRLRSELLHGRARTVPIQQVNAVRTLLEKSLAKELGIEERIKNRKSGPTLLEFALNYQIVHSHDTSNQQ